MRIPEFYPEKQGRPDSVPVRDMESHKLIIPFRSITPSHLSTNVGDVFVEYEAVDDDPTEGAFDTPISSNWAYTHAKDMDEKLYTYGKIIKMLLRVLWDDVDWDNVDLDDLDDVDWDEWE